jgi:hypothetical protein
MAEWIALHAQIARLRALIDADLFGNRTREKENMKPTHTKHEGFFGT